MLIPDHWYPACPSSRLEPETPTAIEFGDMPMVLFRDTQGTPHALLDRCPHRGIRLSLGRWREGRIACGYHGWEFDGDGSLVHVPSLGMGASCPAVDVADFPTVEADHYVWVWIAGEHAKPTYEPQLHGLCAGTWIQFTAVWECNVMPGVENQLDVAHTKFSHPGIYPGHKTEPGERPPLEELHFDCRDDSASVDVVLRGQTAFAQSGDAKDILARFELPYRNYVFLEQEGIRAIYNWVPLGEGRCRLEFMGTTLDGPADPEGPHKVVCADQEIELLRQDRVLLESAQRWFERGPDTYERSVAGDIAPLAARRLVRRALAANGEDTPVRQRPFSLWA